jgi:hypothetical protein
MANSYSVTSILPFTMGIFFVVSRASAIATFTNSDFTAEVTGTPAYFEAFCFSLAILIA